MYIEFARPERFWERHLAQRLARPGPNRGQRAESRTEINPHLGLGAVESRHIHR